MQILTYRALALLEGPYAPKVGRREPFWRPRRPKYTRSICTPAWSWESVRKTESGQQLVDVDVNGAYLAAASSAIFAHGALEPTGPSPRIGAPGYYLIDAHPWAGGGIVSPLGTAELPDRIWVAHPTMMLLSELAAEGYWPAVTIRDSYTASVPCRLRKWAERVRDDRAHALELIRGSHPDSPERSQAEQTYQAIKDGYSIAVQMMLGKSEEGEHKARILRPDWYHTIHAQHAASTWRKAWRCVLHGNSPAAMGSVDELTFTAEDYDALITADVLKIDQTGRQLGAFKVKAIRSSLVAEESR